jgi:hypothetical protein
MMKIGPDRSILSYLLYGIQFVISFTLFGFAGIRALHAIYFVLHFIGYRITIK